MPNYSIESFTSYLLNVKSKNTATKYTDAAKHFLSFVAEKGLNFDSLPPSAMGDFVTWLIARDLAPRSVSLYVAGARSYLRWCEGHGLATPVRLHADLPKADAPVPNALRSEALLSYLRAASKLHEPVRTALLLLPYCGLRAEEITSLKLTSIRKVALPLKGGSGHKEHLVFIVRGKGNVVRIVPILLDGVPIFLDYLKNWRQYAHPGDWLFPGTNGDYLATRTLRSYCQRIRDTMPKQQKLTPHTLRDTYITTLWKCGVDIPTLTKIAGHKSVQTTYNHYLDIQDEDVASAVVQKDARLIMQTPGQAKSAGLLEFLRQTAPDRQPH